MQVPLGEESQLTFWVFYSPAHSLPELYFQVSPPQDLEAFVKMALPTDPVKLAGVITRKEHPVEAKRVVYYLHECRLGEAFDPSLTKVNILVQWLSTVMPAVFGLTIISADLVYNMKM